MEGNEVEVLTVFLSDSTRSSATHADMSLTQDISTPPLLSRRLKLDELVVADPDSVSQLRQPPYQKIHDARAGIARALVLARGSARSEGDIAPLVRQDLQEN